MSDRKQMLALYAAADREPARSKQRHALLKAAAEIAQQLPPLPPPNPPKPTRRSRRRP